MKLKQRLIIAFFVMILIPVVLFTAAGSAIMKYQVSALQESYDVETDTVQMFVNPMQILSRLTKNTWNEIGLQAQQNPDKFKEIAYLDGLNEQLKGRSSYLVVRKNDTYVYIGNEGDFESLKRSMPEFDSGADQIDGGYFIGGESPALVKQRDFYFDKEQEGSIFVITAADTLVPQIQSFLFQIAISLILIIVFTAVLLMFWIYQSILSPINTLRMATNQMSEGNLEYPMDYPKYSDEIGELCQDFEDMRKRMKALIEEQMQYEENTRELMSNISHDLKTPLTAIKGYAEGMLDGVADTPERREKYLRTIYNKAADMTYLVDELSFFSKIDSNAIPYHFVHLNMDEYFSDCVAELSLDLEVKNIDMGYFNYVEDKEQEIIVDAEQLKRVINNIIGNSVKYMDKARGIINFRIQDHYDCVQIEIEDNGKGVAKNEISYIFDRFYRTDASRNSSQGGTGLGLSICRKIIEDHGGRIWAFSKEGVGTSIFFTLKKYNKEYMEYREETVDE